MRQKDGYIKTYLACAFGVAAARASFTVRYHRTSRLLHTLTLARQAGTLTPLLRTLAKTSVLILDDWMRDPLTLQNAQDLLEVLDDRFGHSSTIIASQVPVTEWHGRLPDPTLADAILDRLVHNAQRLHLEGESQRKLRANRSMSHTEGTIFTPALFSPLTVRHAPFCVCAFTVLRILTSSWKTPV